MPVDLSNIGLTGIQQANQTLETKSMAALRTQQTQAANLENSRNQLEQDLDKQVAAQMNNIALGKGAGSSSGDAPDSRSGVLRASGDMYRRGGAPKRAMDFYKAADEMEETENKLQNDEITREQNRLENHIKTADIVSRSIGTARSVQEWDAGIDKIINSSAFSDEEKAHFDSMRGMYSPESTASLNDSAMTASQRANISLQEQRIAQSENAATHAQEMRERAMTVSEERLKEVKRVNDLKGRTGKVAGSATEVQVKNAARVIRSVVKDADQASVSAGAVSIANRANAIIANTQGIDYDTALNQAVIESQAAGDWNTVKADNAWYKRDKPDSTSFTRKQTGKTSDRPMIMPMAKTELKSGKYYVTSKGVARWNGQSFEQ